MSSLGGALISGVGFGAGSEVAHRAVGSMFGGGSEHGGQREDKPQNQKTAHKEDACGWEMKEFYKCMDENQSQISSCQYLFDIMQQCRKDAEMNA